MYYLQNHIRQVESFINVIGDLDKPMAEQHVTAHHNYTSC